MAAFAGLALDRTVVALSSFSTNKRLTSALGVACFNVVQPAILGFNAHRFWVATPRVFGTSPTAVVIREASIERCDLAGYRNAVFARARSVESVRAVFEYYRWDDRMPLLFRYEDRSEAYEDAFASNRVSCILFIETTTEAAQPTIAHLKERARQMGKTLEDTADTSGKTHVLILPLAITMDVPAP